MHLLVMQFTSVIFRIALCKFSYCFSLYFNDYNMRTCIKPMWCILQAPWGWHNSVETCRSVMISELIVRWLAHCTRKYHSVCNGYGAVLQIGRSLVRFQMVSLKFFIDVILPVALWSWGRLSLQQKWVPGVFPGGKGGRCVRLTTYHHPGSLSRNLGTLTSWNPLGTSGL